jgi:hypothetical protein
MRQIRQILKTTGRLPLVGRRYGMERDGSVDWTARGGDSSSLNGVVPLVGLPFGFTSCRASL